MAQCLGRGSAVLRWWQRRGHDAHAHDPCRGSLQPAHVSDVQTFLPGANEPVTSTPDDTADFWSRGCSWQGDGDGTAAELTIFGALTSNGNACSTPTSRPTVTRGRRSRASATRPCTWSTARGSISTWTPSNEASLSVWAPITSRQKFQRPPSSPWSSRCSASSDRPGGARRAHEKQGEGFDGRSTIRQKPACETKERALETVSEKDQGAPLASFGTSAICSTRPPTNSFKPGCWD
jgi:hypothetical protein